jgi:hypothetical protein
MAPLYVLLGGIIVFMTVLALPAIISDVRGRRKK